MSAAKPTPARRRRAAPKAAAKPPTATQKPAPEPFPWESITDPDAKLASKIAWVQSKAIQVEKTGQVAFGKTRYAVMQEHALIELLQPLWTEAKIAVVGSAPTPPFVHREGNHVTVGWQLTVFDAETGHQLVFSYVAEGVDSADKATPKAMTMANKYAMQKLFQVATEAIDDADATSSDEHDEKGTNRKPAGAPVLSTEDAGALIEVVKNALDQKKLSTQRVKAYLQQEFQVDKIQELTVPQGDAFGQWLTAELKES